MNNKILIKVSGYVNKFINKCIKNNINIYNINYIDNDNLTIIIDLKDYKRIVKLNYYSDIKIIKYLGLNGLKQHIKKYLYTYIVIILCFILMDVLTSYIVDINIIHGNKSIRNLVSKELYNNGIKKYSISYSFDELENIKNKILNDNKDTLEWMSITKDGMKYIIRVEERIINKEEKQLKYRHIISKKNAYITKVISSSGEVLVRSGDYVKPGDILISGEIKLNDEIKKLTTAKGNVYGNVWYYVNISLPKEEEIKEYTKRNRKNININNRILFKNKYKYFDQNNIKEFKILGFKIKIYNEKEYKYKKLKYSKKELENLALKKTKEEFKIKLNNKGTIISQKVLKKEENNSKIEYRIFVVTNELINDYLYIDGSDSYDTESSL